MMYLRASQMPLLFACPASAYHDGPRIDGDTSAARLGTAVHKIMQWIVDNASGDVPDVTAVAEEFGVDPAEVAMLSRYGLKAWAELEQYAVAPETEVAMRRVGYDFVMTGHADVLGLGPDSITIIDWKSGRGESSAREQMLAYLWLAQGTNTASTYTAFVVQLRQQYYDVVHRTASDLEMYEHRVSEALGRHDTFSPGDHCTFCPRRYDCPARTALVRSAIHDLEVGAAQPTMEMYTRVQAVARMVEEFRERLREHIAINGPITGDGAVLTLATETREEIDARAAWPHLIEAGLTDDEIAGAVKITKSAMLDAVAGKAEARGKGKAKAQFMDLLRDAGAVHTTEFQKLKTEKIS